MREKGFRVHLFREKRYAVQKKPLEKYPDGYVIQNDATVGPGTPWKIELMANPINGPPDALIVGAVAYWIHEHQETLLVFDHLAIRVDEVVNVNGNGRHHRARRIAIGGIDKLRKIAFKEFQRLMNDLTAAVFRVGEFDHFAHLSHGEITWVVQFVEGEDQCTTRNRG